MIQNKTFLQNLNWERDQGIQLGMINDKLPPGRNLFYDKILNCVQGKQCVEIGFGTGLLSMIALHHGAEHVEAWESDYNRFLLGTHIIDTLQLNNKITLYHGLYNKKQFTDKEKIVFHEIIGSNIWNEGMRDALPLESSCIIPGEFLVEFDILSMTKETYEQAFLTNRRFEPNLSYLSAFTNVVQQLINETPQKNHLREELDKNQIEYQTLDTLDFYRINLNQRTINKQEFLDIPTQFYQNYSFDFDQHTVYLLYPHNTICHDDLSLHWGWYKPVVISSSGNYTIAQNFTTGDFTTYKVD